MGHADGPTGAPGAVDAPEEREIEAGAARLSTAPEDRQPVRLPRLDSLAMARWCWRQLTSMRIALVLLFLLALAAIPGSLLPQREVDPTKVTSFYAAHKTWAPVLDKLQMFDVFESAWFGAIYCLLFISLIGCILPRSLAHARAMRSAPPAAPRNLKRLPVHACFRTEASADNALAFARVRLRRKHFRATAETTSGSGWVSAEKGYLREAGNLMFHLALLGILTAVAIGHFFGFKGALLVTEGGSFTDAPSSYAELTQGPFVSATDLPPFSFTLDRFAATYQTSGDQFGQPRSFDAYVSFRATRGQSARSVDVRVNSPLTTGGTDVFLEGHGYAPVVTVKDSAGRNVFSGPVVSLGEDEMFDSSVTIKAPGAGATDLGFAGILEPTAVPAALWPELRAMPASIFPAAQNPVLLLAAYSGSLGLDTGIPQSVYTLDTAGMKQIDMRKTNALGINALILTVGQTQVLPGHLGSITFNGVKQWTQFNIAHDPGQPLALASALLAVLGLIGSLGIRRRRIFVRVADQNDGTCLVEIAGLARTEGATPTAEVTDLVQALAAHLGTVGAEPEPAQPDDSAQGAKA